MEKTIHHGRNVKRFREMLGIKQDALAADLGDDWNQQKVSLLEGRELLNDELLNLVAEALKVPAEVIKKFDEEMIVNFITNTIHNSDNATANQANAVYSYHSDLNPTAKWLEALEEIKRLNEELLRVERQKVSFLEKMLERK